MAIYGSFLVGGNTYRDPTTTILSQQSDNGRRHGVVSRCTGPGRFGRYQTGQIGIVV
jgi:hypothetical protein